MTPLDRLVDAVAPESQVGRAFTVRVEELVIALETDPSEADQWTELAAYLADWRDHHEPLRDVLRTRPDLAEIESLSERLRDLAIAGLEAIEALASGAELDRDALARHREAVRVARSSSAEMVISVAPAIERLIEASHATAGVDR